MSGENNIELSSNEGGEDATLDEDELLDGALKTKPKRKQTDVELVDNRPKKPTGLEAIKENVKELHEVIAYMDYSFERAFTI